MQYATRDGRKYSGDTAYQVVDAMRADSSFTEEKDLNQYMRGAAARYATFENVTPRSDSPENFLDDLVAANVLSRMS